MYKSCLLYTSHYDDEAFDEDRETLIETLQQQGIERVINVCAEVEHWNRTVKLMEKYRFIYGAVGVHPDDVGSLNEAKIEAVSYTHLDVYKRQVWRRSRGLYQRSAV